MTLLIATIVLWGILISCGHVQSQENERWSYSGTNGPDFWGKTYGTCDGAAQSPINILKKLLVLDVTIPKLHLNKCYSDPQTFTLENVGYGLHLVPGEENPCSYDLDVDGVTYVLAKASFHWGANDRPRSGSEHAIDGEQFDMEAQFVYIDKDGKISIFSFLFKLSEDDNAALEPIITALKNVGPKGTTAQGSGLVLAKLFKPLISLVDVIRYTGSLTIPECTEGIKWLIFQVPKKISQRQLKAFQSLTWDGSKEIGPNFRPLQPINDRAIYRNRFLITAEDSLL